MRRVAGFGRRGGGGARVAGRGALNPPITLTLTLTLTLTPTLTLTLTLTLILTLTLTLTLTPTSRRIEARHARVALLPLDWYVSVSSGGELNEVGRMMVSMAAADASPLPVELEVASLRR